MISSVSASIHDFDIPTQSTRLVGKLKAATTGNIPPAYSLEANTANSNQATNSVPVNNEYWFWYVAPDDFNRGIASDNLLGRRKVKIIVQVSYTTGAPERDTMDIEVVRPPLMLVHGLAGSDKSWINFTYQAG